MPTGPFANRAARPDVALHRGDIRLRMGDRVRRPTGRAARQAAAAVNAALLLPAYGNQISPYKYRRRRKGRSCVEPPASPLRHLPPIAFRTSRIPRLSLCRACFFRRGRAGAFYTWDLWFDHVYCNEPESGARHPHGAWSHAKKPRRMVVCQRLRSHRQLFPNSVFGPLKNFGRLFQRLSRIGSHPTGSRKEGELKFLTLAKLESRSRREYDCVSGESAKSRCSYISLRKQVAIANSSLEANHRAK